MSRNQAKRPSSQSARRAKGSGPRGPRFQWRWILPVAILSSFIGLLLYLHSVPPINPPMRSGASKPHPNPANRSGQTAATGSKSLHFQFYKMLPDSKVVPPKVKAYNPGKALDDDNYNYFVQTGSFRHAGDAERQKARIAFQGLRAEIRKVTNAASETWYRVQIGPYRSRSKMNSAIDKLVAINIAPMVRKVPAKN